MFVEFFFLSFFLIVVFGYSARNDRKKIYYILSIALVFVVTIFLPEKENIPTIFVPLILGFSFLLGFFLKKNTLSRWFVACFGDGPDGEID